MGVSSMTGFARVEGAANGQRWSWEVRTVNGRGLETRFRLPTGFEGLDLDLRRAAAESLSRGNLGATLTLKSEAETAAFRVNERAARLAIAAVKKMMLSVPCDNPRPEGILALRGVIEADEVADDADARAVLAAVLVGSFKEALGALGAMRRAEGDALGRIIAGHIDRIDDLTQGARAAAAAAPAAIRDRLLAQLRELLSGDAVAPDRIAQEAALLAVKADVREELDRLAAHVEAARALLADSQPAGRRLDFLTQELNREANTLCAKAQDIGLKRIGLDLKVVVDQMREQVQNIE